MKSQLKIYLLFIGLVLISTLVQAALSLDDLHNIKVKDIFISDDLLNCPKQLNVLVQIQNDGKNDENIFVELSSPKLKVSEVSQIFNIKPGSIEVANFDLVFTDGIEGEHEFEAAVFFNKESNNIFKSFTFKVCQKDQPPVKDIHNLELKKTSNQINQHESYKVSAQTLFLVTILFIIFMLAILYIIKVYLEK